METKLQVMHNVYITS